MNYIQLLKVMWLPAPYALSLNWEWRVKELPVCFCNHLFSRITDCVNKTSYFKNMNSPGLTCLSSIPKLYKVNLLSGK